MLDNSRINRARVVFLDVIHCLIKLSMCLKFHENISKLMSNSLNTKCNGTTDKWTNKWNPTITNDPCFSSGRGQIRKSQPSCPPFKDEMCQSFSFLWWHMLTSNDYRLFSIPGKTLFPLMSLTDSFFLPLPDLLLITFTFEPILTSFDKDYFPYLGWDLFLPFDESQRVSSCLSQIYFWSHSNLNLY